MDDVGRGGDLGFPDSKINALRQRIQNFCRRRVDAPGASSRESSQRFRSADSGAVVPGIVDQMLEHRGSATPRVGVGNEDDAPALIQPRDQVAAGHDFCSTAISRRLGEGAVAVAVGARVISVLESPDDASGRLSSQVRRSSHKIRFFCRACARAGHPSGSQDKCCCARSSKPVRLPRS